MSRNPGLFEPFSPSEVRLTIRDGEDTLVDGTMNTKAAFTALLATIHMAESFSTAVPDAERWGPGQ